MPAGSSTFTTRQELLDQWHVVADDCSEDEMSEPDEIPQAIAAAASIPQPIAAAPETMVPMTAIAELLEPPVGAMIGPQLPSHPDVMAPFNRP